MEPWDPVVVSYGGERSAPLKTCMQGMTLTGERNDELLVVGAGAGHPYVMQSTNQ